MELYTIGDNSGDVYLIGPEGRSGRYTNMGNGIFAPTGGLTTRLVLSGGVYTATFADQTKWTFDGNGHLTAIVDRYGNQSSLAYNSSGQLQTISDPAGRAGVGAGLTLGYDTSGRLHSVTDWASPARQLMYGYDSNGRLSTVADRTGQQTTFCYDDPTSCTSSTPTPHLARITDANGHVAVSMIYDSQGRVQRQWDALGTNASGQRTEFVYGAPDGQGNVTTTVTYPTTSFDGFAAQQIDTFNNQGQIIQHVSKPNSTETITETVAYDANGFRNLVTDARGNTTRSCFDTDYTGAVVTGSRGNLTRAITAPPTSGGTPPVSLVKYDTRNNVVETVAPKGIANGASICCSTNLSGAINSSGPFVTDLAYDTALGTELLSITRTYADPDLGLQTATTTFAYSDSANPGLVTSITPPRGNVAGASGFTTTLSYSGSGTQAGLLLAVTDPLGNKTTYAYDAVGRRTSLVDPNGNASGATAADHTWSFVYDNEDRLTQATAPAPAPGGAMLTTGASFDPVGNRLTLADADGQITRHQYDARDSLQQVLQSDTTSTPWRAARTRSRHAIATMRSATWCAWIVMETGAPTRARKRSSSTPMTD